MNTIEAKYTVISINISGFRELPMPTVTLCVHIHVSGSVVLFIVWNLYYIIILAIGNI